MALKSEFYNEINNKENYWIELYNRKLLNIYYINLELKPFYECKIKELNEELSLYKTPLLNEVRRIISNILIEIGNLNVKKEINKELDLEKLISLFLVSQMNNIKINNNNIKDSIKNNKVNKKEYLNSLKNNCIVVENEYFDEELPEDNIMKI